LPEQVNRREIREQIKGKTGIIVQLRKNRGGIITVQNDGRDAV